MGVQVGERVCEGRDGEVPHDEDEEEDEEPHGTSPHRSGDNLAPAIPWLSKC